MEIYGARAKNHDIVLKSSSGGMFTVLSQMVIKLGGAVACAVYDYETHTVKYKLLTDINQLESARGSKYIQAELGNIFDECETWVKQNDNELIFFGTGCQAEAFRLYAKQKDFIDKVYIVDIICHGVSNPKVWQDYISSIEKQANKRVQYITFKDKRNGWKFPYAYALADNKEIPIGLYVDIYNSGHIMKTGCYSCKFTKLEREVDMTIGDFWGIESVKPDFYSNDGNSLILVHSKRGRQLLDSVKEQLNLVSCEAKDCMQPSLISPCKEPHNLSQFWEEYTSDNVFKLFEKYSRPSTMERLRRLIRKIGRNVVSGFAIKNHS
jgi:coenzyme F420-reducing hydrogenase beta subunit